MDCTAVNSPGGDARPSGGAAAKPDDDFLDPVTSEIICDPVICSDGMTYDRWTAFRLMEDHCNMPGTQRFVLLADNVEFRRRVREAHPATESTCLERRQQCVEAAEQAWREGRADVALKHCERVKTWSPAAAEAAGQRACPASGAVPPGRLVQQQDNPTNAHSNAEAIGGGHSQAVPAPPRPQYAEALERIAAMLQRGDYKEAAGLCKILLRTDPNNFPALMQLSIAKGKSGEHEDALTALKKAQRLQPQDTSVVASMGAVRFNLGDMKVRNNHECTGVTCRCGVHGHVCRRWHGTSTRARACRHCSHQHTPAKGTGCAASVWLHCTKGAVKDLTTALALEPDHELALRFRGAARSVANLHTDALCDLDAALRLQPANSFALAHRGVSKEHLGNQRGALEDFDAALASNASNALALRHRALARLSAKDYQGAADDCTALVACWSRDPGLLKVRATARVKLAQYQEALEDCEAAAKARPWMFAALLPVRAECKFKLGDFKGAKADAKKLLKWDPTSEVGRAIMSDERVKTAPWSFPWSS